MTMVGVAIPDMAILSNSPVRNVVFADTLERVTDSLDQPVLQPQSLLHAPCVPFAGKVFSRAEFALGNEWQHSPPADCH